MKVSNLAVSPRTKAIYKFASRNFAVLNQLACFCGCKENLQHPSLYACFLMNMPENGASATFDWHGVSCNVCLDEAEETQKLPAEGKAVPEIKKIIEPKYSERASSHIYHESMIP